ncbi:MAG: hypothetical protein SFZ02_15480 [bacterium]|nr:hypothetical protein [bacterium]
MKTRLLMVWSRIKTANTYWHDALLLGLLALSATFINPNWAFAPLEILPIFDAYNDHWIYTGTMLDLADKFNFVAHSYPNAPFVEHYSYIFERFSFIVPGGVLHDLFPPVIANYVFKLGIYGLSVAGVYWSLRNLFGRRTGLFGALAIGSYAWFLRSAGWEYVDGIGIGYFLMTIALIICATHATKKTTWRILCVLVGVMLINLALANVYWGLFTPPLLLMALWLNYHHHKRPIIQSLIWGALGVVAMALVYGAISYGVRGEWFFLKESLKTAETFSTGDLQKVLRDYNTLIYGYMNPHFHLLPILFLIVGIVRWNRDKASPLVAHQRLVLLLLAYMVGMLTLSHIFIETAPYLIIILYSSYLIPGIFLCLGGIVAPTLETLSDKAFKWLMSVLILTFLLPFALSVLIPALESWQNDTLILLGCVLAMVVGLVSAKKVRLGVTFIAIVLFGWMSSSQIFVFRSDRLRNQETFALAFDAYEAVQARYTRLGIRDVQFIQDPRNTTGLPMVVPSMLYVDAYAIRPAINMIEEETSVSMISPFNSISMGQTTQKTVLITRYPQSLNTFITQFANDYELVIEDTITFQRHDMTFYMTFLSVNITQLFPSEGQFRYEFNALIESVATLSNFDGVETINVQHYRWMTAPIATLSAPVPDKHFDPDETYHISIRVYSSLEAEVLNSFQVSINGTAIPLTKTDNRFEGIVSGGVLNQPALTITFQTIRASNPLELGYSDPRTLAVSLDSVAIMPMDDE